MPALCRRWQGARAVSTTSDGSSGGSPETSVRNSNSTKFSHGDRMGSLSRETDSTQATTATKQYDAFGMLLSSSGSSVSPFGFAGGYGYQEDPDSGLKLLGHRYFDPSTGRFLTRDPDMDGWNWYVYCDGNPRCGIDPDGLRIAIVGFNKADKKKVQHQLNMLKKSPHLRQMMHKLINDPATHTIKPVTISPIGDPCYDPSTGTVYYDPNNPMPRMPKGINHKVIPSRPDVVLAHELGHVAGKPDPGSIAGPGDTVYDVENPYRQEQGESQRVYY